MQCGPETESPDVSGLSTLTGDSESLLPPNSDACESDNSNSKEPLAQKSILIEFPGATRRSEPPWRKELSRRVRAVQERRAREAADAPIAIRDPQPRSDSVASQLELVPQLPTPALNQIVENALRRVERARKVDIAASLQASASTQNTPAQRRVAPAAAARLEPKSLAPNLNEPVEVSETQQAQASEMEPAEKKKRTLRKTRLVAVASNTLKEDQETKPVPLTQDIENVVLNYLESHFQTAGTVDARTSRAGFGIRIVSAFFDLLFIVMLTAPFAAGIELADGNWNDPRIQGLMIGATVTVMMLYLTLLTAFSGQTWGMRLLSIRAIDVRTGLLPTGGQSILRAFSCLLSIATLGLGTAYALIDGDRRTLPDRFSKTVVIRD